ncbi:putative signal peptide protein [Puccinia sorghi]|uniref:Putative signal peptide protein n=1 Tax=Puccinia sorghi TaxID=27349 RepID=A0A0L6VG87_9BASI|nr:putative signal peptide protein [Puccinia sorghi]
MPSQAAPNHSHGTMSTSNCKCGYLLLDFLILSPLTFNQQRVSDFFPCQQVPVPIRLNSAKSCRNHFLILRLVTLVIMIMKSSQHINITGFENPSSSKQVRFSTPDATLQQIPPEIFQNGKHVISQLKSQGNSSKHVHSTPTVQGHSSHHVNSAPTVATTTKTAHPASTQLASMVNDAANNKTALIKSGPGSTAAAPMVICEDNTYNEVLAISALEILANFLATYKPEESNASYTKSQSQHINITKIPQPFPTLPDIQDEGPAPQSLTTSFHPAPEPLLSQACRPCRPPISTPVTASQSLTSFHPAPEPLPSQESRPAIPTPQESRPPIPTPQESGPPVPTPTTTKRDNSLITPQSLTSFQPSPEPLPSQESRPSVPTPLQEPRPPIPTSVATYRDNSKGEDGAESSSD